MKIPGTGIPSPPTELTLTRRPHLIGQRVFTSLDAPFLRIKTNNILKQILYIYIYTHQLRFLQHQKMGERAMTRSEWSYNFRESYGILDLRAPSGGGYLVYSRLRRLLSFQ